MRTRYLRTGILAAVLAVALVITASLAGCGQATVRVGTTAWTANSGLLDQLIPQFEKSSGMKVEVVAGATNSEAIQLAQDGKVDVLLVNQTKAESQFIADGGGQTGKPVMFSEMIIVGPASDPAGIKGFDCPGKSSKQIGTVGATYISRSDGSDINMKEIGYWEKCGVNPEGQAWYIKANTDMLGALQVASDMGGYIIVDNLTWLANQNNYNLVKLVSGCAMLMNQYDVVMLNPDEHPGEKLNAEGAGALSDFMTGQTGQELIGSFQACETTIFRPNAD